MSENLPVYLLWLRCSVPGKVSAAASVFSLVLVAALAGFLQIGRMFYKGVSLTQTQETASQILNDVAESVSAAATISPASTYDGFDYFCAGNVRYTYNIDSPVDYKNTTSLTNGSGYGLVRDTLPGGSACAPPCPTNPVFCTDSQQVAWKNPVELLGDRMRIQVIQVQSNPSVSPDYYTVNLIIAYGDDEVLEYTTPGDPATIRCKGNSSTQQFCAVSNHSTSLTRGVSI